MSSIDRLRKRSQGGDSGEFIFWKDDEEKKRIRFLYPFVDGAFITWGQHYFQGSYYTCPAAEDLFDLEKSIAVAGCPICRVMNSTPSERVAIPAIELDLANPNVIVRVGIISQAFNNFWKYVLDDQNDFGPVNERNLIIKRLGGKGDNTTSYKVTSEGVAPFPNVMLPEDPLGWVRSVIMSKTMAHEELLKIAGGAGQQSFSLAPPQAGMMAPPTPPVPPGVPPAQPQWGSQPPAPPAPAPSMQPPVPPMAPQAPQMAPPAPPVQQEAPTAPPMPPGVPGPESGGMMKW